MNRRNRLSNNQVNLQLYPDTKFSTIFIYIPLRAICFNVSIETLEEHSSTATPLVATHQDVPLGPIIGGVLYNWRYRYAYIGVSRSSVTSHIMADTTCRKTLCSQTFGKPYLIVLYRKTPCNLHIRETLCNSIIYEKSYV